MIAPGGIVQRIAREPSLHLEFLASADAHPEQWTEDRSHAFFFENYATAKKLACDLGGAPIIAVPVDQAVSVEEQPSTLFPDVVDAIPRTRTIRNHRARTLQLTGTQA